MRLVRYLMVMTLAAGAHAADTGVLIPSGAEQLDPSVFSLDEMSISIHITEGDARVSIRQIWGSHTESVTEGTYTLALPAGAVVSDFAVWDGLVRIPGVILERRRAEEIYANLKSQAIDPGLLEQGESSGDDAKRSSAFTAHITPIPAYGSKRIEIEYHQPVDVENLDAEFTLPLKPDSDAGLKAGLLHIAFELDAAHPIARFHLGSQRYPLRLAESTPARVRGEFDGRAVALTEDFTTAWSEGPGALSVLTYRNPAERAPGYFEASALPAPGRRGSAQPHTVVALFDASLSMQWDKLQRSFQALDGLLHSLTPNDRFDVLAFNSAVHPCSPQPVAATAANVEQALACVKALDLRGGSNIDAALTAGLAQAAGAESYLVVISDLGATEGAVSNRKIAAAYADRWKKLAPTARPRTYVFAVGDDANQPLARLLAENDGVAAIVRSTEAIEFPLKAFLGKIGERPLNLKLSATPASNFEMVYPLGDQFFAGSTAAWVGRYKQPGPATFGAGGMTAQTALPAESLEHDQLPRRWAQARVDALLQKIESEGEDRASIDEIIRLSRQYKFVTPYTSFLAAPRSLLRPRVIRPGDPVIRVHTDPAITSVVALFPFGLTKALRFLKDEDVWQARFLAPADMADGTYTVRLILRDRQGRTYREAKTFVIASKPPVVRVQLTSTRVRAGATVHLKVQASSNTRTLTARLSGAGPIWLHWNGTEKANTGDLAVPAQLPPGFYTLQVTAEDIAHNVAAQEVRLEVVP